MARDDYDDFEDAHDDDFDDYEDAQLMRQKKPAGQGLALARIINREASSSSGGSRDSSSVEEDTGGALVGAAAAVLQGYLGELLHDLMNRKLVRSCSGQELLDVVESVLAALSDLSAV